MGANSVQRNAKCWNSTGVGHGPRHYSADEEDAKTVAKNFNGFNVADGFHLTSKVVMVTIRPAKILVNSELSQIKSKIPEYARDYRNEYLFIRGIDKTLEDFVFKYNLVVREFFVSSYSDRIKLFIRNFLKAQELGYLKDTSCFIFKKCDVENIEELFSNMNYDFVEDKKVREDGINNYYSVDLPDYRDFYELFCKFYDKINVGFLEIESDFIDTDSD